MARAALARESAQPAIEFEGRWWSWGDLAQIAKGLWRELRDSGATPGAPVTFIPRNHPASVAALLALIAEGRNIRMVYAFQSGEGIARDVSAGQTCAVVAHEQDFSAAVREAITSVGTAGIALGDTQVSTLFAASATRQAQQQSRDLEIEILTSGTTGPPKRFAVSYGLLEQHFVGAKFSAGEVDGKAVPFLLSFPLGNITGLYTTLPTMLGGQPIVLLDRFRLSAWLDYVRRYRPVHSGLPPSCVQEVLDAEVPLEDLASLGALGVGAAPLDPTVQAAFEDRYGIPILVSYGATEFAGPVTAMMPQDHARFGRTKLGTVGRALPGAQLRIVDPESHNELAIGETGLLEVVSPRIGPEWIRTTDLAAIDADGFLYIRGRADSAILRGGFKVIPESVETALMAHPAVLEAAVVGLPNRRLGHVPVAAIRLKTGSSRLDPGDFEAFLRSRLLSPQIPVTFCFFDDFPRTPSHKIDRMALRDLLVDWPPIEVGEANQGK